MSDWKEQAVLFGSIRDEVATLRQSLELLADNEAINGGIHKRSLLDLCDRITQHLRDSEPIAETPEKARINYPRPYVTRKELAHISKHLSQ
jgi:hypothetical protein